MRLRQLAPRQAQGALQPTPRSERLCQSPLQTQAAENQACEGIVPFSPLYLLEIKLNYGK
jgi:hypothetical protein